MFPAWSKLLGYIREQKRQQLLPLVSQMFFLSSSKRAKLSRCFSLTRVCCSENGTKLAVDNGKICSSLERSWELGSIFL